MNGFDELIQDAWAHGIQGWDWSYLKGRLEEDSPPWDYTALARQYISASRSMLDIGTGGGELLSTLGPFPKIAAATEAYPPSVNLAGQTLNPLGVQVVYTQDDIAVSLPVADASFDLVLNRHAGYSPLEVFRILRPGGRFLTQQVGGKNQFRLNELFQDSPHFVYHYWTLAFARKELEEAGFFIQSVGDAFPETRFKDIGALVYFLKIIDWQVPGFDIVKHRQTLLQINDHIQRQGYLATRQHRFLVEAVKPG